MVLNPLQVFKDNKYPTSRHVNTTTEIPPEVKDFFGGYIGITAKKRSVLHYLAEQTTLPAKSGNSIVVPTFKRIDVKMIESLKEGVTPIGSEIQRSDIKLTPQQYGNYVETTDKVLLTVQDRTLQHFAYILGLHLSEVCDKIIAAELNTTGNVLHATGGGADMGTADKPGFITDRDIMRCCAELKQNSAYMVSPNLFGSTIFGSTPVREAFYSFVNVKVENDLYDIPGFQSLAKYGSSEAAHWFPGEIGEFMNARFISSQNLPEKTDAPAAGDKPHLSNFFVGRYAYYVTRFGQGSTEFILSAGSGFDPLKQRYQIGYKTWYGAKVNSTNKWIIKLVSRTSTTI